MSITSSLRELVFGAPKSAPTTPILQRGDHYLKDTVEDLASMTLVSPHSVMRACKQSARQHKFVDELCEFAKVRARKEPVTEDSYSDLIEYRVHQRIRGLSSMIEASEGEVSDEGLTITLRNGISLWFQGKV
jgi:hypothetical protein